MEMQFITPDIRDTILDVAHRMHRNPELSTREFQTTALLKSELEKLDMEFPAQQPATGIICLLRGGHPGPTIALRADIDALPIEETDDHEIRSENPGVMHACGHDFHTAALFGAAKALSARRDTLQGHVLFIFQPAEEQCFGALEVIASEIFDQYPPAAFYSLHVMPDIPFGKLGLREGPICQGIRFWPLRGSLRVYRPSDPDGPIPYSLSPCLYAPSRAEAPATSFLTGYT